MRVVVVRLELEDYPKDAKSQTALGWSPPLVGDFHKLDRFGEIVFVDEKGELPAASPAKGESAAKGRAGYHGHPSRTSLTTQPCGSQHGNRRTQTR